MKRNNWEEQLKTTPLLIFDENALPQFIYQEDSLKTVVTTELLFKAPTEQEFYKEVWKAYTLPEKNEVAAVLIHKDTEKGKEVAAIEIEALKKLQGKTGIVETYSIVEGQEKTLFVQKLYKGGDLYTLLKKRSLTLREKYILFRDILQALQSIHQEGYLFVDTAPSNILLDECVHAACLTDFGSVRPKECFNMPHARYVLSKFAPELLKNRFAGLPFRESIKTDIWGMGNTFYLAHFGTFAPWYLPMQRREKREALDIMCDENTFPEPEHSKTLDYLIWKMLRPLPHERISCEDALLYLKSN